MSATRPGHTKQKNGDGPSCWGCVFVCQPPLDSFLADCDDSSLMGQPSQLRQDDEVPIISGFFFLVQSSTIAQKDDRGRNRLIWLNPNWLVASTHKLFLPARPHKIVLHRHPFQYCGDTP